jgi:iron complex outermembrane receptor protein
MSDAWRLSAGLTALHERFNLKPGGIDVGSVATTGVDPAYTAQLRSSYAFDSTREVDLGLRRVGSTGRPAVPAYTALDLRFGWRFAPGMELSRVWRDRLPQRGGAQSRPEAGHAALND